MEKSKSIIDAKYYLMLMLELMDLTDDQRKALKDLSTRPDSAFDEVMEKKRLTEYTDSSLTFLKASINSDVFKLSPGAFKLFYFMAFYGAKTLLFAWSSLSDASKVLEMSRPSLVKYINELIDGGFIKDVSPGSSSLRIYALNGYYVSKSKHSNFLEENPGKCLYSFPASLELRKDKALNKYYSYCSFDALGALGYKEPKRDIKDTSEEERQIALFFDKMGKR